VAKVNRTDPCRAHGFRAEIRVSSGQLRQLPGGGLPCRTTNVFLSGRTLLKQPAAVFYPRSNFGQSTKGIDRLDSGPGTRFAHPPGRRVADASLWRSRLPILEPMGARRPLYSQWRKCVRKHWPTHSTNHSF